MEKDLKLKKHKWKQYFNNNSMLKGIPIIRIPLLVKVQMSIGDCTKMDKD